MTPNDGLLPQWALLLGFGLTLFLTFLKVREFVRAGRLDVRLTRELFFRLNEYGETVFANAVLLVRYAPVELREISFELRKTSGSEKRYQLQPRFIGERIRKGENIYADHYFFTTSALELVPKDTSRRPLYMAVLSEYGPQIEKTFATLRSRAAALREETADPAALDAPAQAAFAKRVSDLQKETVDAILPRLQLEAGKYELSMVVTYRGLRALAHDTTETSRIEFEIGDDAAMRWRWGLEALARSMILNVLTDARETVSSGPEYVPQNVTET